MNVFSFFRRFFFNFFFQLFFFVFLKNLSLQKPTKALLVRAQLEVSADIKAVDAEACFNLEVTQALDLEESYKVIWLLGETFELDKLTSSSSFQVSFPFCCPFPPQKKQLRRLLMFLPPFYFPLFSLIPSFSSCRLMQMSETASLKLVLA